MPVPWARGVPVPYPFYLILVGTIATLILFVQQPELATRALSALLPSSAIQDAQVAFTHSEPHEADFKRKRVAVVGAGASGSAAAFFLARGAREAESRAGLPHGSLLDIVVFEAEDYVGGRESQLRGRSVDRIGGLGWHKQRTPAHTQAAPSSIPTATGASGPSSSARAFSSMRTATSSRRPR